jgi:POT family proton-dependent oligopeptide transporter
VRAVFRIGLVFAFTSVFWALFFQYGGSWQIQATHLDRTIGGWTMGAGMLSQLNTVFVLALIPVVNGIYKRREEQGRPLTPLRKMAIGMFVAPLAFLAALALQYRLDAALAAHGRALVEQMIKGAPLSALSPVVPDAPHALWQAAQYFFLSLAEVLISITGLEFAFTQAPKSMKGVVMGMWFLYFSIGAQLTAVLAKGFTLAFGEPIHWQYFFLVFFGISLLAGFGFSLLARWYKPAMAQPA